MEGFGGRFIWLIFDGPERYVRVLGCAFGKWLVLRSGRSKTMHRSHKRLGRYVKDHFFAN